MLALIAMIAFLISPWVENIGDMPMITVGLVFLAAHMVWYVGLPWFRPAP